uniref:Putative chromatin-remodeling complex ATPase chain n=1 Tax=Lygus hesperus TaxID=30085 RepID=A0A0A9YVW6_LYGHE
MRRLGRCCNVLQNPKVNITDEQRAAIRFCSRYAHTQVESALAESGYDCYIECLVIKTGLMEEDKTLNKEKILKEIENQFHEDFVEQARKAAETCSEKKYKTKCPSGIDGGMQCFFVQIMLNCPARYWTDGEECKETRTFMEKCGENPDYGY